MKTDESTLKTIDEYISHFPHDVQEILDKIRVAIRKAAPDAEETIRYQMPTSLWLYPAPRGIEKSKMSYLFMKEQRVR